jgi:hypothetical protein
MIGPVIALVGWTLVMWVWMYATRLPAISKAGGDPQDWANKPDFGKTLPPNVRWVADNYNHLHEQPTLFYALALAIHVGGLVDPVMAGLAWAYVASRVAHSILQATVNLIPVRFLLFVVGTLILVVMTVRAALAL